MMLLLISRIFSFISGVRFYETQGIPNGKPFKNVVFKTNTDQKIEFLFYREVCTDLIYKRGKIQKVQFKGYIIECNFDEGLPNELFKFQGKRYFFNAANFVTQDEEVVIRILLSVFLDHIKEEIHPIE